MRTTGCLNFLKVISRREIPGRATIFHRLYGWNPVNLTPTLGKRSVAPHKATSLFEMASRGWLLGSPWSLASQSCQLDLNTGCEWWLLACLVHHLHNCVQQPCFAEFTQVEENGREQILGVSSLTMALPFLPPGPFLLHSKGEG